MNRRAGAVIVVLALLVVVPGIAGASVVWGGGRPPKPSGLVWGGGQAPKPSGLVWGGGSRAGWNVVLSTTLAGLRSLYHF